MDYRCVEPPTRCAAGHLGKDPKLIVVREGGRTGVMSTRCTHWGCEVDWKGDQYVCPCHGAQFDAAGKVLKGPAKRPLTWYPTRTGEKGDLQGDINEPLSSPPM